MEKNYFADMDRKKGRFRFVPAGENIWSYGLPVLVWPRNQRQTHETGL